MIPTCKSFEAGNSQIHFPLTAACSCPLQPLQAELDVFTQRIRALPGYEQFAVTGNAGTMGSETASDARSTSAKILLNLEIIPETDPSVSSNNEKYELNVSENRIDIFATAREGIVWGLTTLYWLIRFGSGNLQCGRYVDEPALSWRGFLLDSCRHFFPAEVIKIMIEQCSLRKINRMHWHLSDDQGYRIESRKFPRLNQHGSWWINPNGTKYGGFYTQNEIREIVEFARARGVEIVPEIDMPGHVTAIVSSYPEVSCSGLPVPVSITGGIHPRILCAGKDSAIRFAEELIEEVLPLFPFRYYHIGGDEAPKEEWKKCPDCQKRMQELGLQDEEELQAWFTDKITEFLAAKGKTAIGWNEVLKSGKVREDTVVQYWAEEGEGENYCEEAFSAGRKCIYSESCAFWANPVIRHVCRCCSSRNIVCRISFFCIKSVFAV